MRSLAVALFLCLSIGVAHAGPRNALRCAVDNDGHRTCRDAIVTHIRQIVTDRRAIVTHSDPRPRAWCGWWMRHHLGVADRAGNRARWWAHYGSPAHGPHVGAIVVWRHHVGLITGRTAEGWRVKSGNDGHRVRERVRSLRGAIAFRWPEQRLALQ